MELMHKSKDSGSSLIFAICILGLAGIASTVIMQMVDTQFQFAKKSKLKLSQSNHLHSAMTMTRGILSEPVKDGNCALVPSECPKIFAEPLTCGKAKLKVFGEEDKNRFQVNMVDDKLHLNFQELRVEPLQKKKYRTPYKMSLAEFKCDENNQVVSHVLASNLDVGGSAWIALTPPKPKCRVVPTSLFVNPGQLLQYKVATYGAYDEVQVKVEGAWQNIGTPPTISLTAMQENAYQGSFTADEVCSNFYTIQARVRHSQYSSEFTSCDAVVAIEGVKIENLEASCADSEKRTFLNADGSMVNGNGKAIDRFGEEIEDTPPIVATNPPIKTQTPIAKQDCTVARFGFSPSGDFFRLIPAGRLPGGACKWDRR